MGDQGGDGGGGTAAAAAPPAAPPWGANRATLLEQRKGKSKTRLSLGHWSKSYMLRRGQLGLVQQCLPAMANKCARRSCFTLGAEISRMGSTRPHAKPIVTWTNSSQS